MYDLILQIKLSMRTVLAANCSVLPEKKKDYASLSTQTAIWSTRGLNTATPVLPWHHIRIRIYKFSNSGLHPSLTGKRSNFVGGFCSGATHPAVMRDERDGRLKSWPERLGRNHYLMEGCIALHQLPRSLLKMEANC
jgi:hypothetical protein